MNFSEIDKTNPLFPILLSFREKEERMLKNLALYLPGINRRYFHVPFFHSDKIVYTAVYDKFAKEFINILDVEGAIIDLRQTVKKRKGNGAIGMG